MKEPTRKANETINRTTVWHILIALAWGALLGALVAMPYGRWIGLPDSACAFLRSLAATAVLAGLGVSRQRELTLALDAHSPARENRKPRPATRNVRVTQWNTGKPVFLACHGG